MNWQGHRHLGEFHTGSGIVCSTCARNIVFQHKLTFVFMLSAWCVFHVFDCALTVYHSRSHILILVPCVFVLSLRHSHSALFDVVTPPLSCSFSYLYIGPSCLIIHEWEARQKIKQAHHTSVPSECDLRRFRAHGELKMVSTQHIVNTKISWTHTSTNLLGNCYHTRVYHILLFV